MNCRVRVTNSVAGPYGDDGVRRYAFRRGSRYGRARRLESDIEQGFIVRCQEARLNRAVAIGLTAAGTLAVPLLDLVLRSSGSAASERGRRSDPSTPKAAHPEG